MAANARTRRHEVEKDDFEVGEMHDEGEGVNPSLGALRDEEHGAVAVLHGIAQQRGNLIRIVREPWEAAHEELPDLGHAVARQEGCGAVNGADADHGRNVSFVDCGVNHDLGSPARRTPNSAAVLRPLK